MRRRWYLLALLAALMAFSGCQEEPKDVEYWTTYDDMNCYSEPSSSSEVVLVQQRMISPIEIERKDATGEWGYHVISRNMFKKETKGGWLYLGDMIYCGTKAPDERLETYTVMADELELRNHPQADAPNVFKSKVVKNDTVQVTARSGKWVHVRCVKPLKSGRKTICYGWVPEKQLQPMEALSFQEICDVTSKKAKNMNKATIEKDYPSIMVWSHRVYAKAIDWIGYAALGLGILFLIPAIRRRKIFNILLLFPIGILLIMVGEGCSQPSWVLSLAIPFAAYIVCYPLIYFKTSRSFGTIYTILALVASGYYIFLYTNLLKVRGFTMFTHILLLLLLMAVCVTVVIFIKDRIWNSLCMNCGYFAKPIRGASQFTGTSVSSGTETEERYSHTTREVRGNTEYITKHYDQITYDTEVTTDHYKTQCTCRRCGYRYTEYGESSSSRRVGRRY